MLLILVVDIWNLNVKLIVRRVSFSFIRVIKNFCLSLSFFLGLGFFLVKLVVNLNVEGG